MNKKIAAKKSTGNPEYNWNGHTGSRGKRKDGKGYTRYVSLECTGVKGSRKHIIIETPENMPDNDLLFAALVEYADRIYITD